MNEDAIDVDEQQSADLPWGSVVSDGDLIRQFAAYRDQEAFAELVSRHGPLVLGVCRRILRHEQDVEDAFQATFLVLARRAARVRWQSSLANWLYGVAYRTALKARSRRGRLPETSLGNPEMIAANDASRESSTTPSPEYLRLLDEHLHSLPVRYRAPLVLCYLQGKTRDEAAAELGLSVGAVKGRLERGREKLRRRLTRAGLTLPAALPVLAGAAAESAQSVQSVVLPKSLAAATVDAALNFAEGHLTGAALSPQAVTLAQGELTMMKTVTVLKCLAAVLLVSGAVGGGLVAAFPDDSLPAKDREIRVAQADPKPADKANAAADRKDEESIQGTWQVMKAGDNGNVATGKQLGAVFVTITKDHFMLVDNKEVIEGPFAYKLDPSQDPKALTFNPNDETPLPGIYELQGDQLKIVYNETPADSPGRPTKFASERGTPNDMFLELKRVPAKANDAAANQGDAAAESDKDAENIQGTWKIVEQWSHARQTDQEELDKEAAAGIRMVISKTAITPMKGGDVFGEAMKYTLDPSQTPKTIDFQVAEGQKPGPGIYDLKGDTLRILFNDSSKDRTRRPTKLPTKDDPPGEEFRYLVLQRENRATLGDNVGENVTVATAQPVVVKTVPQAGATDVSPDVTEIQVTFSKVMQPGSWSWSTAAGQEHFPETSGPPKYLEDGRTCVLPVKLEPGKTYAMWLNSQKFQNFKDARGRSAVPYLLVFQTKSGGE